MVKQLIDNVRAKAQAIDPKTATKVEYLNYRDQVKTALEVWKVYNSRMEDLLTKAYERAERHIKLFDNPPVPTVMTDVAGNQVEVRHPGTTNTLSTRK